MATTESDRVKYRNYAVGGAATLVVLLALFVWLLTGDKHVDLGNPFWLVGLLVIFGAALTLIAMVFRALNMANKDEAFGLPSGSIRTLLAIGIMVLFAVFGLSFFDSAKQASERPRPSEKAVEEVEAPAKGVDEEVKRYESKGFAVVVKSRGSEGPPPVNAQLKLFRVEISRPADIVDMQKQMLTAVATLLTTVIGFYFGSRSAEGARDAKAKASGTDGADPKSPGDDDSKQLEADVKALDGELKDALARLDEIRDAAVPEDNKTAFTNALTGLDKLAGTLKQDQATLGTTLQAFGQKQAPATAVQSGMADLRKALTEFANQLAQAQRLAAQG